MSRCPDCPLGKYEPCCDDTGLDDTQEIPVMCGDCQLQEVCCRDDA